MINLNHAVQAAARRKAAMKSAASIMVLVTGMSSIAPAAHALPAVFFNGDLAAGEATFVSTAAAADAAYNTANPGATQTSTIFRIDLTNSTGSVFSTTANGQTVWVRTELAGAPAANNQNGRENNAGFTTWDVDYTPGNWNEAVATGYKISFYSDAGLTTPYLVNAVGLNVSDWGTCCTNAGTLPDGSTASASEIYMLFNGSTPIKIGGISSPIASEEHFIAGIDDRNSFSSVTVVPNGIGEFFGAGGILTFSTLQIGSVPAGSSVVTVGDPGTPPDIDTGAASYTVTELNNGDVNPVFDGGVLEVSTSGTVNADLSIKSTGGAIDTGGNTTTFAGDITDNGGAGGLTKTGSGVLELTGNNTFSGGLTIDQGTVRASDAGALGTGDITLNSGGALQSGGALTVTQNVNLAGAGTVDTSGGNTTLAGTVGGAGSLTKSGSGVLELSGGNTFSGGLNIGGGTVRASDSSAFGTGGITIGGGATLQAGGDMTLTQNVHVSGPFAAFDTGANDVTVAGGLTGDDCLNKTGSGRMNLVADASNAIGACVQQGTLSFNSAFNGNVWVFTNGVAGGSGQINGDMEVRGVLAPGNSPGRLIVAGSVTQMAGSTLAVEIDGRTVGAGAGAYDTLALTGAGSVYTAGGTLSPILRGISGAATNTFTPVIGDVFEIVTAEGGVQGSYAALTQPTAGLAANTRFDIRYLPNAVWLTVTADSYAALLSGAPANATAVGGAVDDFRGAAGVRSDSAASRFADGLAGLNAAGLARTLEQAAGGVHANSLDAVLQTNRASRGAVSERLSGLFGERGGSARPETEVSHNLWGTVIRDVTHVGGDAYSQDYRAENTSWVVGYDRDLGSNLVLGVAAAFGESQTENALAAESDAESFQGMVYGRWTSGATYVSGIAVVGGDSHDVERQVALSTGVRTLKTSPDGMSYGVDVEAGHRLQFGSAMVVPAVGLAYDRVQRDGFSEAGDAAVALRFGKDEREALAARIGARVSAAYDVSGVVVRPYGAAFVTQELSDAAAEIAPTLHGESFAVRAPKVGRTGVRGEVGVDVEMTQALSVRVGYQYADSDNARSNVVSGGLNLRW